MGTELKTGPATPPVQTPTTEAPNAAAAKAVYDGNAAPTTPPASSAFHTFSPAMSVIDDRGPELWAETGAGATEQQQLRQEARTLERIGLPDGLVATIIDGHISGRLGDARLTDDDAADDRDREVAQRIVEDNARVREAFATKYGRKDGEELLARTQRFVRAHPALAKVLQQHGLGSRPDIVEGIAAHVFSTGWRR